MALTRSVDQLRAEIEERFGFFPPFFAPALDLPAVLENLWQQTLASYVGNALPPLFLERLFAVLSRYCDVPYCVVCHSCALRPLGMDAGQILDLLDSPHALPDADAAEAILTAAPPDAAGWGAPGPLAEAALRAAVSMFLRDGDRARLAPALRRVLPPADYDQLVLFLGYVTTCLEWVEGHPELSYEADQRAIDHLGPLLNDNPALGDFFADYPNRRGRAPTGREAVLTARAEEAEGRFTLAFDEAPIGMALISADGRFLKVNQALCDIVGYDPDTLTTMTLADITHPDDLHADEVAMATLLAGKARARHLDKRYRHRRGSWIWVRLSAGLLRGPDGTPLYFVTQIEDITERREHQQQLAAANAELRRSNQDLERFAAMAAHDLKAPLAVVSGNLALLTDDLPPGTPAELRDTAARVTAATERMAALVDDLLAYARVGTEPLRTEWVDVDILVAELLHDLDPVLRAADAHVAVGQLGEIWAHPTHLRQVFGNLVTNAVKYATPGTRPRVEISAADQDDTMVFTVADNGIGVPEGHRRSIFDMFSRAHAGRTAGTGIGLAICHRIVERHGGSIWVEEQPHGGSRFRVRLPRYRTAAPARMAVLSGGGSPPQR